VPLLEAEALREVVVEHGVVGLDVWEMSSTSKRDELFVEKLVLLLRLCFLASGGVLAREGVLDAEVSG
jgi:hypothetical protein